VIVPFAGKFVGPVSQKLLTQGQPIAGLLRAGRTVLGKVGKYEELADKLGANRFSVPRKVWEKMSDAERWAANQKFLDEVIKTGDEIILSDPVTDVTKVTGYFRRELDYLISQGFRLSADGTRIMR
jgi:hypothetical protein